VNNAVAAPSFFQCWLFGRTGEGFQILPVERRGLSLTGQLKIPNAEWMVLESLAVFERDDQS
jgi:hypothetical protein